MHTTLTIIRYKKRFIPFALLAMALFRWPLWRKKGLHFYKLMGSGRNGSFDKTPDWQQWAILVTQPQNEGLPLFLPAQSNGLIKKWLCFFRCEVCTIELIPIEGHGTWDQQPAFGNLPKTSDYEGPVAVLTRATIRFSKLSAFWSSVDQVARQMQLAPGFIRSFGIGEVPFLKQATFSIWQDKTGMKAFAYQMQQHRTVIQRTRKENWYSEDMFVRFIPKSVTGTVKGENPLKGIS